MKEAIARTKICPFITSVAIMDYQEIDLKYKCITTKCMAWVNDISHITDALNNRVKVVEDTGHYLRLEP